MTAIARGDGKALEELYRRHAPTLLLYLGGRLHDPGLAEELLQDVMLAAWRGAPRFRGECRVRTWLFAIARNRLINAIQRRNTSQLISLDEAGLEASSSSRQALEQVDSHDELYRAIRSLPDEQRETLELVFFHGMSIKQVALIMRVSPGTVKSRLHRTKDRLRVLMHPKDTPDERTR